MDVIAWFTDPAHWSGFDGIPTRIAEHLVLCAAALLAATLIGLPIGLYIGHTGRAANLAINIANIGRAIPSYAVLVMLLPISLGLAPTLGYSPTIGLRIIPTFLAMALLAIPPILVNAYAGLQSVDRDLIEAGRGQGLREGQILRGIEIPLASSVIVGGFRTAALQVIATATIGAIVSYGGLGRYIIDGIARNDLPRVVAGAVLVAGLAIAIDLALAGLQRLLTPRGLRRPTTRGFTELAEVPQPAAGGGV
ncbi:MAG: ABC transporter permease [Chloroflexi bacterium]|nr:ABC transporter permease [Chloroflexota bacterium]